LTAQIRRPSTEQGNARYELSAALAEQCPTFKGLYLQDETACLITQPHAGLSVTQLPDSAQSVVPADPDVNDRKPTARRKGVPPCCSFVSAGRYEDTGRTIVIVRMVRLGLPDQPVDLPRHVGPHSVRPHGHELP